MLKLLPASLVAQRALKGIDRTVQLYRVIQPSRVRGRLEATAAARGSGDVPLRHARRPARPAVEFDLSHVPWR